jgi:hypothetical protein
MNNAHIKTEPTKGATASVQKSETTAFVGAEVGKCFNKV